MVGGGMILAYEARPAPPVTAPAIWPAATRLTLDPQHPTLVMFAHPRCPCTRASLREFARILETCGAPVEARVEFFAPPAAGADWLDSPVRRLADSIPGITVEADIGGQECSRFGAAAASGTVVLYGPDGKLLFAGGITPSRGHEGDSAGGRAVLALLRGGPKQPITAPVFGCPVANDHRTCDVCNGQEQRP